MTSPHLKNFYVQAPLKEGERLELPTALRHRLGKVLRMKQGDTIALFNGQDGLVSATIAEASCRAVILTHTLRPMEKTAPLHLILALPKRDAWESALRQATELGVTTITPLKTRFSQVGRLNAERATLLLTEAAEQSERLGIPLLHPLQSLPEFLSRLAEPCAWAYERATEDKNMQSPLPRKILVGPEGGFAPDEVELLAAHPHIRTLALGRTILRVDTAVVAGLTKLSL